MDESTLLIIPTSFSFTHAACDRPYLLANSPLMLDEYLLPRSLQGSRCVFCRGAEFLVGLLVMLRSDKLFTWCILAYTTLQLASQHKAARPNGS